MVRMLSMLRAVVTRVHLRMASLWSAYRQQCWGRQLRGWLQGRLRYPKGPSRCFTLGIRPFKGTDADSPHV